jgi:hypothetical protein
MGRMPKTVTCSRHLGEIKQEGGMMRRILKGEIPEETILRDYLRGRKGITTRASMFLNKFKDAHAKFGSGSVSAHREHGHA